MDSTPEFLLFFGRFHPLIVHLPIGFLLLAGIMELLSRKQKYAHLKGATNFAWGLGTISAFLAVALGLMLAEAGGYNADTLFWHKWLGIVFTLFSAGVYAIKTRPQWFKSWGQKALLPAVVGVLLLMTFTGHLGGSLARGSEYLLKYAPQPIRSLAGLPPRSESMTEMPQFANIEEAKVFDQLIHPMIKGRCQSCHGTDKMKGGLRVDTREKLLEGGEGGAVFVANDLDKSELFRRISLPEDHDDFMPPEGKRPLTDDQIKLIGWWIKAGAPLDQTVAEMGEIPEDIREILDEYGQGGPEGNKATGIFAKQVPPADPNAINRLATRHGRAMAISQQTHFLQVQFAQDTLPYGDADIQLLMPLAEQITWLDLRNTQLSDFSFLAKFPNLTRIHLEKSQITDEGLAHVAGLSELEYLNLYGTTVSNAGLRHLENLTKLKALYLWQTQVDSAGAKFLIEKIPDLEINLGWEQARGESNATDPKPSS